MSTGAKMIPYFKDWKPQKLYPMPWHICTYIARIWEYPPSVFPAKSICIRRLTLTLQMRTDKFTHVLHHSRIGILVFLQNVSSLLTSDTATPWETTGMSLKNPSIYYILVHSGKFLANLLLSNWRWRVIPCPGTTADIFLSLRTKGKKWGLKVQNWRPILPINWY